MTDLPTIRAIRIAEPEEDGARLVTLDAGWGTLSYWVAPDGTARQAGLGESVPKEDA